MKDDKLHKILDKAIEAVDQQLVASREVAPSPPVIPISPLHMTQKLGFKPVVTCDCGSSIDLNTAKRREVEAWTETHQTCTPIGAGQ